MLDSAEMPGAPAQDSVEGPVVPAPRAGVVQGSAAPKTCLACGAGLTGADWGFNAPGVVLWMRRGYEVFRSLSPAASCDLLIRRDDGLTARVEVRTVRRNREGRVGAGARPSEAHRFDVLARVEPSGAIHYTGLGE